MTPEAQRVLELALQLAPPIRAQVAREILASLEQPALSITVEVGDITQIPAEALITGLNSQGNWGAARVEHGQVVLPAVPVFPASVDGAIQRLAGTQFHQQAIGLLQAPEGQTVVATTVHPHHGCFRHVVFVVDDLQAGLDSLLLKALQAADAAGLQSVNIPAMRTGVARNYGGTVENTLISMARAVQEFQPRSLREVCFVVTQEGAVAEGLRRALKQSGGCHISVILGDITRVEADGLITGLNSQGMWGGGVDRAIYQVAGEQFHRQAQVLLGKSDGTVVVASSLEPHQGAFRNVVFVVDDLHLPLYDILSAGLAAAAQAGFTRLTIPAMRTGVLREVGGTMNKKIADMARAVLDFRGRCVTVQEILFVIYGDPILTQELQRHLGHPT